MFQTTNYPLVMTNITNWKITVLLLAKLTISMAMFQFAIFIYQRVWFWLCYAYVETMVYAMQITRVAAIYKPTNITFEGPI